MVERWRDDSRRAGTEYLGAEALPRSSEDFYRLLLESLADSAIVVLDPDGVVVSWAAGAEQLFGYTPDTILGQDVAVLYTPADIAAGRPIEDRTHAAAAGRHTSERQRVRADGSRFWSSDVLSALRQENGELVGFLLVARDLTARREAEEALRASEARFRTVFSSAAVGVALMDLAGRPTETNPALQSMLGYTEQELRGITFPELAHPDDRDLEAALFSELLNGVRDNYHIEIRYVRKDGQVIWGRVTVSMVRDDQGQPRFAVRVLEDVTAQRRAEELSEQVRHFQRIEAVGRLAGGVAHDFNNLVTVIEGHAQLLGDSLPDDSALHEELAEIRRAAERAASLTRQLLAFSRQQVLQPRVLDLNGVVRELGKMLRSLLGEDIQLVTTLDKKLGAVEADRSQIEQVIVNLAVNARDAMPDGGKLEIQTSNMDVTEGYAAARLGMRTGPHVVLSVIDAGHGIPEHVLPRIFEPFFTTKEPGRGTGLGLSTVYGIVKQSGGYVEVETAEGTGTTFRIYLPRVEAKAKRRAAPEQAARGEGGESVLLVEDESGVRALVSKILRSRGYSVLEAPSPAAALEICRDHADHIDLLLTDVVMPEMTGRELSEYVAAIRPETRILFMSGYAATALLRKGALDPGMAFIGKPFTIDALVEKVREVLDAPRT